MSTVTVTGGTKIEWADFTFNPWWGCEKVSPGCAHCYAETLSIRRQPGKQLWGEGHDYRLFGDAHWAEPLKWARLAPGKLGRRPRVFCASMADVFEPGDIRIEGARRRLFGLIGATPELDWLVLTKRPEFAREWMPEVEAFALVDEWPLPNVWLGVSIENARFTWRADVLREIPAAVRFISAEPLLGSLYKDSSGKRAASQSAERGHARLHADGALDDQEPDIRARARAPLSLTSIDWVIIGGESGHGARPMRREWAWEIVADCIERGNVDVFVKQLGSVLGRELDAGSKGQDFERFPVELRVRDFPGGRS